MSISGSDYQSSTRRCRFNTRRDVVSCIEDMVSVGTASGGEMFVRFENEYRDGVGDVVVSKEAIRI